MALPEESARFRRQRTELAISLAMQSKWEEAVIANQSILRVFPEDVDAYNRLGKAYTELGQYDDARDAYGRALTIEPINSIAKRNLTRLAGLKSAPRGEQEAARVDPSLFIGETGKTTVVNLIALGDKGIVAKSTAGDIVDLRVRGKGLEVFTSAGEYVGLVEPKVGLRVVNFMQSGNRYEAAITSVTDHQIKVMLRETYQAPDMAGRVSFPSRPEPGFRPYVKERLVRNDLDSPNGFSEDDDDSTEWEEEEGSAESGFVAQSLSIAEEAEEDDDDEEEEI